MDRRSAKQGFTLVEIMVVVGVIGILAAIAIPNFLSVREEAFISSMKSDLASLRLAQESHRESRANDGFAETLGELDYDASDEVTVTMSGDGSTWAAQATHPGTSVICSYSWSDAAPVIDCSDPVGGKK